MSDEDRKFVSAVIIPAEPRTPGRERATIIGWYYNGEARVALQYFDDELTFHAHEIVDKTFRECQELFSKKDIAYLQS